MTIRINQLDPSQENILNEILSQNDDKNISIIYGPPGTGKSHLIVSILFELAIKGKHVLFVSQNTEALDVITRMIQKLERDLFDTKNENYISFTDFCLVLKSNEKSHRMTDHIRKKYLKETFNRLNTKIFPKFNKKDINVPNDINYCLSYTNLDKEINNDIQDTTEIGTDELLYNYLKNVKSSKLIYTPIKFLADSSC